MDVCDITSVKRETESDTESCTKEWRYEHEGAYNRDSLAKRVLNQTKIKHLTTKVTSSASSYSKLAFTQSCSISSSFSPKTSGIKYCIKQQYAEKPYQHHFFLTNTIGKGRGCHIATVVYGSYDVPEVMMLCRLGMRHEGILHWDAGSYAPIIVLAHLLPKD